MVTETNIKTKKTKANFPVALNKEEGPAPREGVMNTGHIPTGSSIFTKTERQANGGAQESYLQSCLVPYFHSSFVTHI